MNIKYIGPTNNETDVSYYIQMLMAACDVIDRELGGCQLSPFNFPMLQKRQLKSLYQHKLDVVWTVTTRQREEDFRPIRIPLMKGLIGYRIAVANKHAIRFFKAPLDLAQIKKLSLVQGHDWPDTPILKSNGFNVLETTRYEHLYSHVAREVYDYTLRGVLEVYREFEQYRQADVYIEPNYIFQYPSAIYYFVRKDDKYLADLIEEALKKLIQSGEFERLFSQSGNHQTALSKALIEKRKVISLDNPIADFDKVEKGIGAWYQNPNSKD